MKADAVDPACPICGGQNALEIRSFSFRPKRYLPGHTRLLACSACDLVYSWPRDAEGYERYYGEVANDFVHTVNGFRNMAQLDRISSYIDRYVVKRVLDFGCGGGGLLTALAARHRDVTFVGDDVNPGPVSVLSNLTFTQRLLDEAFDLVILSHVLEHAVAPAGMISEIMARCRPRFLYLEVPDPSGYPHLGQPQFLYYVDRLHINHFSAKALRRLAGPGFGRLASGAYAMPYDLGPEYPCQYMLLGARRQAEAAESGADNVLGAITTYFASETERLTELRIRLSQSRFYLYGYGDNCLRNMSEGGAICGLEGRIIGVIDRSIGELSSDMPANWRHVHPDALTQLDGQMIVCTVTQSGDLAELFAVRCPHSEIVYI